MDDFLLTEIRKLVETKIMEKSKIVIYPYGNVGMQIEYILKKAYGIIPEIIIDNRLCDYNDEIKHITFLEKLDASKYKYILCSTNEKIYVQLKKSLLDYVSEENIYELECMHSVIEEGEIPDEKNIRWDTKVGRHSYGAICKTHPLIESIGNFCSFAQGTDVVFNHPMRYVTTHMMMCYGKEHYRPYRVNEKHKYFVEGITPHDDIEKSKRTKIGNDVWLGRNVIVCNGANIGNGVVAGAGAIITKDVPDYAIVVGVPAKIIKYRFSKEQITALNQIKWWDWSDEEIRERYEDFYLPIDKFIEKYKK